jgi:hypothetical protein
MYGFVRQGMGWIRLIIRAAALDSACTGSDTSHSIGILTKEEPND